MHKINLSVNCLQLYFIRLDSVNKVESIFFNDDTLLFFLITAL